MVKVVRCIIREREPGEYEMFAYLDLDTGYIFNRSLDSDGMDGDRIIDEFLSLREFPENTYYRLADVKSSLLETDGILLDCDKEQADWVEELINYWLCQFGTKAM